VRASRSRGPRRRPVGRAVITAIEDPVRPPFTNHRRDFIDYACGSNGGIRGPPPALRSRSRRAQSRSRCSAARSGAKTATSRLATKIRLWHAARGRPTRPATWHAAARKSPYVTRDDLSGEHPSARGRRRVSSAITRQRRADEHRPVDHELSSPRTQTACASRSGISPRRCERPGDFEDALRSRVRSPIGHISGPGRQPRWPSINFLRVNSREHARTRERSAVSAGIH